MNKQAEQASQRADELMAELQARANGTHDQGSHQDGLNQDSTGNTDKSALENTQDKNPLETGAQDLSQKDEITTEYPQKTTAGIDWEQRYNVLQGKYNKEVPDAIGSVRKAHQEKRELEIKINGLNQKVSELTQAIDAIKNPAPDHSAQIKTVRDDFGNEVADILEDSQKEIADLKGQVTESKKPEPQPAAQGNSQEEDPAIALSMNHVISLVGGKEEFDRIDNDPGFTAHLKEIDPYYNVSKQQVMNTMFANGNLDGAANFFISWRDQQQTALATADVREELIEPVSRTGEEQPETKRIYKESEIQSIYHDLTHNSKYRTKDGMAEAEALENDLLAAGPEGRIRRG